MSKNPRRFPRPVRLIVTVAAVDALMERGHHHQHRNRSEFVRQAIERELVRCQSDDSIALKGRLPDSFKNSTRA